MLHGNINEKYAFEIINFETYYTFPRSNNDDKFDIKRNYFEGVFVVLDLKMNFNNKGIRKNIQNEFSKENQKITNELLNYISDYKDKNKLKFDIVLKEKVYIKFYIKNMFAPNLFGKILDKKMIYNYWNLINFLEGLAEIIEKSN